MKAKFHPFESGQILVVLVLALIGLLGFTALAIDVGMTYSNRRYDQSAADSASLAGAQGATQVMMAAYDADTEHHTAGTNVTLYCPSDPNWKASDDPGTGDWVKTAMHNAFLKARDRAGTNGFTLPNVDLGSESNLQTAQEGIYVHCIQTPLDQQGIYTYVMVSSNVQTSLAHMVFGGAVRNTVTSVTRSEPLNDFYHGAAIVSLDPVNCSNGGNGGGTWFDGNIHVTLTNGGVHSNSCINKNGSGGDVSLISDPPDPGSPDAEYMTGGQDCGFLQNGVAYCTVHTELPLPRYDVIPPACGPNQTYIDGTDHMHPGTYNDPVTINGKNKKLTVTMEPGLYCFKQGFSATAGNKGDEFTITGNGVTIYMDGGLFEMEGNANYNLSAPAAKPDPAPAVPGMLVLFRYTSSTPDCQNTNASEVKMEGNSEAHYTGTIYAPCSQIDFGGNSGLVNSAAQLIGNTVKVHGNPTTTITYEDSLKAIIWPLIDLQK